MITPISPREMVAAQLKGSGFTRAKKIADLTIKASTDSTRKATSRGYEQAIQILTPYIDAPGNQGIDAQRIIAGYNNSLNNLAQKERNQNETVSAFKLQELDSYFTSFDGGDSGGFRNPANLINATSESLDNTLLGVLNAIDEKQATNQSTDVLRGYLSDLQQRADIMRDLKNRFNSGELAQNQVLDNFGYYVDTNPIDGSIRRAALLPAGIAPEGIAAGFKRLDATAKFGSALLPIYAPYQKDAQGNYMAKIGDASWSGSGDGALTADKAITSQNLFGEGEFDITDKNKFAIRENQINKGSFGKGFIGRDANGQPVESILYRGNNNKLYSVNQNMIDKFQQDPVLSQKLNGYVPQFSPSEMTNLYKEATPMPDERIAPESKITGLTAEAQKAQAEASRIQELGFFGKIKEGLSAGVSKFFSRTNVPTPPTPPAVSESAPDIIQQARERFFLKQ